MSSPYMVPFALHLSSSPPKTGPGENQLLSCAPGKPWAKTTSDIGGFDPKTALAIMMVSRFWLLRAARATAGL
jgi:hypothetical protein